MSDDTLPDARSAAPCPKCGHVHKGCTAHSKHRDAQGNLVPCRVTAPLDPVTHKCRMHNGGRKNGGMAHGCYVHGRRSKYLKDIPAKLRGGYRRALRDPELHSVDDEIAALESRLRELFRDLSKTEAPPWGRVIDSLVSYEQALKGKDKASTKKSFARLQKAIRQGSDAAEAQTAIWDDLKETMALKAKLAAQAHGREIDLAVFVRSDEALMLFDALLETAKNVLQAELEDPSKAKKLFGSMARRMYDLIPGTPTGTVIENEE